MTEYEPPDPSVAEMVYRTHVDSARQHARLKGQSLTALKAVVRDTNETTSARMNALLFLLKSRDPELPDMLLELLEDPDQNLWRTTIRSYCPDDPRIRSRLVEFLDDDDDRNWSEAAVALSRSTDETLLPVFAAWLHDGDRSHRNVAIECLKRAGTGRGVSVLQDFWDSGAGDIENRLVVAAALLSVGDNRGLSLLDSIAATAHGTWSVFCATAIYVSQARDGLRLMMHILDDGDLEAQRAMVNQIWNFARLPHAFTADGIHEARLWVRTETEKQVR